MRVQSRWVGLWLCLVLTGSVGAATYYVSPTGSDTTGDGSAANPWRTIGKAAQMPLQPGDLVSVAPGNYPNNKVTFRHSGAAAVPLTTGVRIEPPNRLIFPAGTDLGAIDLNAHPNQYYLYLYRSWRANSGAYLVTNAVGGAAPYVEVAAANWRAETGTLGDPSRLSACVARPIVFRNSSPNRDVDRVVVDASGSSIYTLFYIGDYKDETRTDPANFIFIDGFDLTGMQGGGVHLQNSSFVVLRDLRVWNGGAPGILMAGQDYAPAVYNMILECRVWNTPYEGIYLGAGGQSPANNHLHYAHVLNNEVFTVAGTPGAALENAIDLKEYNTGHTVVGNLIHDLDLVSAYNGAIFLQHDTRDALIYNNRLRNISSTTKFPAPAITLNVQNSTNVFVFNNVIYRTAEITDRAYAFQVIGNQRAADVYVTHNTISQMPRALYLEYYDAGTYDITIANNIFSVTDVSTNLIFLGGGIERGVLSHNLWSTAPARYTNETGRVTGDPRFVAPGTGDLRLQPDSPAVDTAGFASPWVAIDQAGHARPYDGGYDGTAISDRGALEYVVDSGDDEPPTPPSGLRLLGRSPTSIVIGWNASTDNVGVAAYRVERNGVLRAVVTELEFEDTGLSPATPFTYRVRAVDLAGNPSAASDPLTAPTQNAPDGYTMRFDFGHPNYPTPGNWNQVASANPNDLLGVLVANAVDAEGTPRGISLSVINDFYGVTTGGVNADGAYPASAGRDGWWVGYYAGYGEPDTVGTIRLDGFNPAQRLDLIFFGSRADTTYDRRTVYASGSVSTQLDAANNLSNTARLDNLQADTAGRIEFSVSPLLSTGFGYLNVLEVVVLPSGAHAITLQGTPYAWLQTYYPGQTRYFEAIDLQDTDGDGFTTGQEYIADTNPTDATDRLPALDVAWIGDGVRVSLSRTSPQRIYHLQSRRSLTTGTWEPVASRPGTGTALTFEPNITDESAMFYRVQVTLP